MSFADANLKSSNHTQYRSNNRYNHNNIPTRRVSDTENDLTNDVALLLKQFNDNLMILQQLVGFIGTSSDSIEKRDQLNVQLSVVNELSERIKTQIYSLKKQQLNELQSKRAVIHKLSNDYSKLLDRMRHVVRQAKEKIRQYRPGITMNDIKYDEYNNNNNNHEIIQQEEEFRIASQLQEQQLHDALFDERREEIKDIHQSVHQVNQLFKDLAQVVDQQQEDIESIEAFCEQSHEKAEQGLQQIQKAAEYQPGCIIS